MVSGKAKHMDDTRATITEADELRSLYGEPSDLVQQKSLTKLDKHCRNFIAHSPFLVLATAAADGPADVSPKGDAPGFVQVLDDETLLIPDRRGNNRLDGLKNVLENPHVAIIFLVPGVGETLRVNGRASITNDPALLEPLAVNGKTPATGLLVQVDEAFLHCAKAVIRSKLWDPAAQIERKSFPSIGRMIADQVAGLDAEATDAYAEQSYRERLY